MSRRGGNGSTGLRRIPEADFQWFVTEGRQRHNLSDIVGRHTTLKRRGSAELVGLCCFHSERSPSLEVNDAKGTYHCHGCGAGGDAIRFLTTMEGMTFRDALEWLLGDELPVISEEERVRRKQEDQRVLSDRIGLARQIWSTTVRAPGTPAEVYARARGLIVQVPVPIAAQSVLGACALVAQSRLNVEMPMLDVSREASLQMDSAPADPPTATTVMVSLWQMNMIGIRAERFINWGKRRDGAVQYITGAAYA